MTCFALSLEVSLKASIIALFLWSQSAFSNPEVFRIFCSGRPPFDKHFSTARTDVVADYATPQIPLTDLRGQRLTEIQQILPLRTSNLEAKAYAVYVERTQDNEPLVQIGFVDIQYAYKMATTTPLFKITSSATNAESLLASNSDRTKVIAISGNEVLVINSATHQLMTKINLKDFLQTGPLKALVNPRLFDNDWASLEVQTPSGTLGLLFHLTTKQSFLLPTPKKKNTQQTSLLFVDQNHLAWIESDQTSAQIITGELTSAGVKATGTLGPLSTAGKIALGKSFVAWTEERRQNSEIKEGNLVVAKISAGSTWTQEKFAYPNSFLREANKYSFGQNYITNILGLPTDDLLVLSTSISGGFYTFNFRTFTFQIRASVGQSPCLNPSWAKEGSL